MSKKNKKAMQQEEQLPVAPQTEEVVKEENPDENVEGTKEITEDKEQKEEKKNVLYKCSNGALYNRKEDAEDYQRVLNPKKEIEEVEV